MDMAMIYKRSYIQNRINLDDMALEHLLKALEHLNKADSITETPIDISLCRDTLKDMIEVVQSAIENEGNRLAQLETTEND